MNVKKHALTLLALSILLPSLLGGCANKDEKIAKGSELDVYNTAQRYLKSSSWDLAIETLQLMEENYPFGAYAEQSQLELIFAYFKANEHEAAIASADRFIRLHPQHRSVDYAYYMRGIASFYNDSAFVTIFPTDVSKRDPGTAKDAFNYFSQLLNRYPKSHYALDAQRRMVFLRNILARYEIHVANYYFKRGAYLAAVNRGRYVVESMQTTPAVPDGLAVMAQAYHLLGMKGPSDNAIAILKENFSDHPALKNGQFNFTYGRDKKRSWLSYVTLGLFDKRDFIKFDSRALYDPFYQDKFSALPPAPPGNY